MERVWLVAIRADGSDGCSCRESTGLTVFAIYASRQQSDPWEYNKLDIMALDNPSTVNLDVDIVYAI